MKGGSNNHFSLFAISLVGSCSVYIDVGFQKKTNLPNACGKVVGYQCQFVNFLLSFKRFLKMESRQLNSEFLKHPAIVGNDN